MMDPQTTYCRHEAGRDEFSCPQCRELMDQGSIPMYEVDATPEGHPRWKHDVKCLPQYFDLEASGVKPFTIRRNDRDYRTGDVLRIEEWNGESYTGRMVERRITCCTNFMQQEGFVVLGLAPWLVLRVQQRGGPLQRTNSTASDECQKD